MAEVSRFTGKTLRDLPPDQVLEENRGTLTQVLVLGVDADGNFTSACSTADTYFALWLAQKFCHEVLAGAYEDAG